MIFEMPSCGGCRTCEMACSFKHTGEFKPSILSIKILEKERAAGFLVSIAQDAHEGNLACDCFSKKEGPLCLEYCLKNEDLLNILKEFALKAYSEADRAE